MAKVYRCREVDISEMTQAPLFQHCDFEARGETTEEVLKQAIAHVREVHSEPVEQLLGTVFKGVEGESPEPEVRADIPEGPARAVAEFMGRLGQFISSGSARRVIAEQVFPVVLIPKLREAIVEETDQN